MKRGIHLQRRERGLHYERLLWACGAFVCMLVIVGPGAAQCTGTLQWEHPARGFDTAVALSPDGTNLTAGSANAITVFDAKGIILWSTSMSGEYGLAMSAAGESLAVGGSRLNVFTPDGVIAWKWSNGYFIVDVDVDQNGSEVVVCVDDATLRCFNLIDGGTWNLSFEEDPCSVARSKEGGYIVCGSDDGQIYLFNSDRRQLWKYRTGGKPIRDIAISSGGARIAALSDDGMLYVLSLGGRMLWSRSVGHTNQVAITDEGSSIATGGDRVHVYSGEGDLIWSYTTETRVGGVDLSADGSRLAAADQDRIYVFSLDCEEPQMVTVQQPVASDSPYVSAEEYPSTLPEPSSQPAKSGTDHILLIAFSMTFIVLLKRRD
jgi:WD40 repeat protein